MNLISLFYIAVSLVLGLGLLVIVHELGHFLVARWAGVRVETFSIGFGRRIAAFTRGETEYKIAWIPLGGYVKMAGEDPDDAAARTDPGSYSNKPVYKRIAIVLAGPAMNLVLAALIMPLVFLIGRERPAYEFESPVISNVRAGSAAAFAGVQPRDRIVTVDGVPVATWEAVQERIVLAGSQGFAMQIVRAGQLLPMRVQPNALGLGFHPAAFLANEPIVDTVMPDSAAQRGGLQPGDRILRLAGQPIQFWDELTLAVGKGRSLWFWWWAQRTWRGDFAKTAAYVRGDPMSVDVQRNGVVRQLAIEPNYDAAHERYLIGVTHDAEKAYAAVPKVLRRYGLFDAIARGERENWRLVRVTGEFLGKLVKAPEQHYESLGGPVRIIGMFAKIAQEGLSPFLYFLCFFSLQLGLLNLLPIPVLDGGHVVFLTIEALRRKPLAVKAQSIAQHIGLAVLLSIFAIVTFNDLSSFDWIRKLVGRLF